MTTDAVGGVWNFSLELARALRPRGVEFLLAVLGPLPCDRQRAEAAAAGNIQLRTPGRAFALEWMADPWDDVARAGEWLLELEEAFRPDVVHLNGFCHGSLPWSVPALVAAHSDVFSWWRAVHGGPAPASWTRYRAEVKAGLRGADLVTAPTRAMLEALEECYLPVPENGGNAGRVVPNARDAAFFAPKPKRELVLAAGRAWDRAKNMRLLEAAADGLPWPVFLAGATESPDGESVEFANLDCLGPLPPAELAHWMGVASIFTLPARYEPFGLAALEAGLAGCALVLGDIPSLREVWGDAALFVSPDEPEALSAALLRLIADAPLRARMAARANRRALSFTPRRLGDGYLECYQSLLARTGRPVELDALP